MSATGAENTGKAKKKAVSPADLQEQVVEALKTVYDPEIPVNIYELGLIYNVEVNEARDVKIEMTLTSPNCPAAQSMPGEVEYKTRSIEGVGKSASRWSGIRPGRRNICPRRRASNWE